MGMTIDIIKTLCGIRVDNPLLTNGEYEKKKKKKWDKEYGTTIYYFELFLKDIICMINGIDKDVYIDEESLDSCKIKFNKDFKTLSLLEWDSDKRFRTDDKESRARFLTLTLFQLMGKTDKTIRKMYPIKGKKRYKKMYKLLMFYIKTVSMFIVKCLHGKDYSDELLKIQEFIAIRKQDEKTARVLKYVLSEKEKISDMIITAEKDRKIVDRIMKLAYTLATFDIKHNDVVLNKKKKELTVDDEDKIRKRIFKLGDKIIKYKTIDKKHTRHPKLYKNYLGMHSKFYSKFTDINQRVEMAIGVKALDYLKFILNDRVVTKYINKMILN